MSTKGRLCFAHGRSGHGSHRKGDPTPPKTSRLGGGENAKCEFLKIGIALLKWKRLRVGLSFPFNTSRKGGVVVRMVSM